MENRPYIGVGVIIRKDGKVLFGKRKNAHGEGSWCCPGGHLEFGETIAECARREAMEEAGITVKNIKEAPYTEDFFKEGRHYITLYIVCDYDSGEVKVMESDKCEQWDWFRWNDLPDPLFLSTQNLLKRGYDPFK